MTVKELNELLDKLLTRGYGDAPVRWLYQTKGDPWTDGQRVESATFIQDVISGEKQLILG